MYFPKRDPLRLAAQGMTRIVIYDVDIVVKQRTENEDSLALLPDVLQLRQGPICVSVLRDHFHNYSFELILARVLDNGNMKVVVFILRESAVHRLAATVRMGRKTRSKKSSHLYQSSFMDGSAGYTEVHEQVSLCLGELIVLAHQIGCLLLQASEVSKG